ncbi:haloacid dehalogenase type II [Wenxinia saemankumensis]|uniref:(S)-2-haloacid dehalogenase n=1 Tax=Wenxinia saemankumensis TaxID=1447782 RepID=A0A1M6E6R2_9RHOB|nr:haloacid dehalogenase type II [Wenxinia saemankumensis]SHI81093.1 2-haloacid dehalogenase [Wenxinia saemankumensis]
MAFAAHVFDAYGTLFDVTAAARRAAEAPGQDALRAVWPALARDWRDRQLGWSWLRAAAGRHADFWSLTQDALDWAMAAHGLDDPHLRERLLALYWELEAFPEVPDVLARLAASGARIAILSNGSPGMLDGAVTSAGIGGFVSEVISVEAAGIFKPAPAAYDLVAARLGTAPGEVLFVSSNCWDAAAAAGAGFTSAWVNRADAPPDRLWAAPHHVLSDLTPIPDLDR